MPQREGSRGAKAPSPTASTVATGRGAVSDSSHCVRHGANWNRWERQLQVGLSWNLCEADCHASSGGFDPQHSNRVTSQPRRIRSTAFEPPQMCTSSGGFDPQHSNHLRCASRRSRRQGRAASQAPLKMKCGDRTRQNVAASQAPLNMKCGDRTLDKESSDLPVKIHARRSIPSYTCSATRAVKNQMRTNVSSIVRSAAFKPPIT